MHSWAIGCSDLRHLVLLQHYKRPKLFCLLLGLRIVVGHVVSGNAGAFE